MVCLLYLHGNTAHFKIALESSLGFAFLTNSSREKLLSSVLLRHSAKVSK